jgi:hypothetical protein
MLEVIVGCYSSNTSCSSGWILLMVGCVFGKFQVAFFSDMRLWDLHDVEVVNGDKIFSSSVCCDRSLAFHMASWGNVAIIWV